MTRRDKLRKSARFSDSQLGLKFHQDWFAFVSLDATDQKLDRFSSQLMLRQFDRRQPRTKNAEPGIIVEAHQAEIVGTLQSHFLDGLEKSNRHEVVRDVDAIGSSRKQSVASAKSGFDAVVAFDDEIGIERQTAFVERVTKSAKTLFRVADAKRAADERNAAPSGTCEMSHGFVCALVVIADDSVFRQLRIRSHEQHERDIDVGDGLAQRRLKIARSLCEHDAVDAF